MPIIMELDSTILGKIILLIIVMVDPMILLITAGLLWDKSPRWIPYVMAVTAIIKILSIAISTVLFFRSEYSNPEGFLVVMLFPMGGWLLLATPAIILIMAIQIKKMEIQYDIPLPHEATKTITHEVFKADTNDIQEKGILKVNCPECGETLKVSEKCLHNTEKCKSCNTEFIPYDHIWY